MTIPFAIPGSKRRFDRRQGSDRKIDMRKLQHQGDVGTMNSRFPFCESRDLREAAQAEMSVPPGALHHWYSDR